MSTRTTFLSVLPVAVLASASLLVSAAPGSSPWTDRSFVPRMVEQERKSSRIMDYLDHLANGIGPRPAGSKSHHEAGAWALRALDNLGLSNVHLEEAGYVTAYPDAGWAKGLLEIRAGESPEHEESRDEMVPVYNVVADIPGTDRPDEYVIIGAHFDSVPIGTGALDNGAGVAAVMEAARLLVESGVRPKRTIRCILFAAEELQHLGSESYVEAHPELMWKISAVYIMDRGTDYISAITATEPLKADLEQIFAPIVHLDQQMPFKVCLVDYLPKGDPDCAAGESHDEQAAVPKKTLRWNPDGSMTVTAEGYDSLRLAPDGSLGSADSLTGAGAEGAVNGSEAKKEFDIVGGSDHLAFLEAGVPAFWWIQEGDGAVGYPAHTKEDTYDKAIPEYLEHSATIIAVGALGTANLDHMLSRERLADPGAD